eukprot:510705_1
MAKHNPIHSGTNNSTFLCQRIKFTTTTHACNNASQKTFAANPSTVLMKKRKARRKTQGKTLPQSRTEYFQFLCLRGGVGCVYQFVIFGGWRSFLILSIFG